MITKQSNIKEVNSRDLRQDAITLHYVLYEREKHKEDKTFDEKELFDRAISELKSRGIHLEWLEEKGTLKYNAL